MVGNLDLFFNSSNHKKGDEPVVDWALEMWQKRQHREDLSLRLGFSLVHSKAATTATYFERSRDKDLLRNCFRAISMIISSFNQKPFPEMPKKKYCHMLMGTKV